jgi:hypothetical protein
LNVEQRAGAERLRPLFGVFAAARGHGRSAVYETLSAGIAGDDELLGLALSAPPDQRKPSLLFAAVNVLLASHPDAELAAYYPVHGGDRPPDERLVPAFRDFCEQHRGEIEAILRDRSTQTNDIRRCVALRLGLDRVQREWPGPAALMEVGASAGLNLIFDSYRYRLGGQDQPGAAESPVLISCGIVGDHPAAPVFGSVPDVTQRLGIDRSPVDLADPAARAWLEAFIWPEQTGELATLRDAIGLALSSGAPPPVVRGDAVTDTARLLAGLGGGEPVVVFTASLLSYLDADGRASFAAQLAEAARQRPVAWVFAEAPGLAGTAGVSAPALDGPLGRRTSVYAVGVTFYGLGRHDDILAVADPYLRWMAPARTEADSFEWAQDAGITPRQAP